MPASPALYKKVIRQFRLNLPRHGLVPFPMQTFQEEWIDTCFSRTYDEDEQRWVRDKREVIIGVGRKNAKTETTAAIALANMLIDSPPDGLIVLAAAKREQAALLLNACKRFVSNSMIGGRPLSDFIKIRRDHLYFPEKNVVLKTIAAEAQKEHGLNPHLVIVDEGHATLETSRELYDTLLTAQGVREDPLAIIITTAGPAPKGPMYELYQYGCDVRDGKRPADPAFGFIWHEAARDAAIDDLDAWRAANPAFDSFPNFERNARRIIQAVLSGRMPEFMARRLHLNQWTFAAERWLPFEKVDACGGTPIIPPGAKIVIGLDAALRRDTFAVAFVHVEERGEEKSLAHLRVKHFTPAREGEYIDHEEIVTYVLGLAALYDVEKVVYDPAFMQLVANALSERVPVEPFPQSAERMERATETFWRLFTHEQVRHGNDPDFLEHLAALAVKPTERGVRMSKMKAKMPTDLAIAAALALDTALGDESDGAGFIALLV